MKKSLSLFIVLLLISIPLVVSANSGSGSTEIAPTSTWTVPMGLFYSGNTVYLEVTVDIDPYLYVISVNVYLGSPSGPEVISRNNVQSPLVVNFDIAISAQYFLAIYNTHANDTISVSYSWYDMSNSTTTTTVTNTTETTTTTTITTTTMQPPPTYNPSDPVAWLVFVLFVYILPILIAAIGIAIVVIVTVRILKRMLRNLPDDVDENG